MEMYGANDGEIWRMRGKWERKMGIKKGNK